MEAPQINNEICIRLIKQLYSQGINTFVVCGGSRNTPLIAPLSEAKIQIFNHFEERSAGFYALGISKRLSQPVGIVVTSGTAAAELLPSCIESYYQELPLIFITADRPKIYRGTGAPQAIDQVSIFGNYATAFDIDAPEAINEIIISSQKPTHINVCLDEPLIEEKISSFTLPAQRKLSQKFQAPSSEQIEEIARFLSAAANPIIILSELNEADRNPVKELCLQLQLPLYAEPLSGLREEQDLRELIITCGDKWLSQYDAYLRIGAVPVTSFWRALARSPEKTLSVDRREFSGLPSGRIISGDITEIASALKVEFSHRPKTRISDKNHEGASSIRTLLESLPLSEPAIFSRLSKIIPSQDLVYLGNSLPIREWDLAATRDVPHQHIYANRGANGIDGQLSTYLGVAREGVGNWCIVGDLTTLYDFAGLWSLKARDNLRLHICVINNQGGQIFERLPAKKSFASDSYDHLIKNTHRYSFQSLAAFWGIRYQLVDSPEKIDTSTSSLIEIKPDPNQTKEFWARYDAL